MKKIFTNNGLSIVFLLLFILTMIGQTITGIKEYDKELLENGGTQVDLSDYFKSGHFIEATFENWESEFLQMGLFVWLTVFLKQKGSSESKTIGGKEEVERIPSAQRHGAPWPVKKGGIWLALYKHSLSLALLVLFLISFALHFYGSLKDENTEKFFKLKPPIIFSQYITDSKFWFESFQKWESEFLSIFAIIVMSIYLREYGST